MTKTGPPRCSLARWVLICGCSKEVVRRSDPPSVGKPVRFRPPVQGIKREKRSKRMIHLGDITKIHGDQIEPVDCITFGSPCQDLSIAGHRAGLAGERSGLFMEAVRIIKEMRKATDGVHPAFAVWENVPGAFSSNGGEDFRAVLEELARVEQPDASIPRPANRGGQMEQSRSNRRKWMVLGMAAA